MTAIVDYLAEEMKRPLTPRQINKMKDALADGKFKDMLAEGYDEDDCYLSKREVDELFYKWKVEMQPVVDEILGGDWRALFKPTPAQRVRLHRHFLKDLLWCSFRLGRDVLPLPE
jgi:hypothetical protein